MVLPAPSTDPALPDGLTITFWPAVGRVGGVANRPLATSCCRLTLARAPVNVTVANEGVVALPAVATTVARPAVVTPPSITFRAFWMFVWRVLAAVLYVIVALVRLPSDSVKVLLFAALAENVMTWVSGVPVLTI